jgi:hypothetical protein
MKTGSNLELDTQATAADDRKVPRLPLVWRYRTADGGYLYADTSRELLGPIDPVSVSCTDCGRFWASGQTPRRALAALALHRDSDRCLALWEIRAALWDGLVPDSAAGVSVASVAVPALREAGFDRSAVRIATGSWVEGGRGRRSYATERAYLRLDLLLALVDLRAELERARKVRSWGEVFARVDLVQDPERIERVNARLRRIELARGLREPLTRSLARMGWSSAEEAARAVRDALREAL